MTLNASKFAAVVETAKAAAANSPKWLKAIERAAAAILSGEMIITTIDDAHSLVTTAHGSYWTNGTCQCKAAQHGHRECYHRAGAQLWKRYEAAIYTPKTEPTPAPKAERKAPVITRSIERDYTGVKVVSVRYDGWEI